MSRSFATADREARKAAADRRREKLARASAWDALIDRAVALSDASLIAVLELRSQRGV